MVYVTAGGLKACAWADLIQGSALILGGAVVMIYAFKKLGATTDEVAFVENVKTGAVGLKTFAQDTGAIDRFWQLNKVRMNMFLPKDDKVLPCTALMLGLWIPNFYYWGLNQYITQRTLASESLAEGQKGIVFSAFMKLLIPFVVVIPGIIAFNLYSKDMQDQSVTDNAPVIAKYLAANQSTQLVEVVQAPSEDVVANWSKGKFMIAIYPDDDTLKAVKTKNPFVLPLTQEKLDGLEVTEYTVFESDDKSWKSAFPELAAELQVYNASVMDAAQAAGVNVTSEKFIAYKYDTALGQLTGGIAGGNCQLTGGDAKRSFHHLYNGYFQEIHKSRSRPEVYGAAWADMRRSVLGYCGNAGAKVGRSENQQQHIHHHPGEPGTYIAGDSGSVCVRPDFPKSSADSRRGRSADQYCLLRRNVPCRKVQDRA
jgi:SSS family solute:Na+ symporter